MARSHMIQVLVATQSREVYRVLGGRDNVAYDIALYTGSIKEALPNVRLVIIDYADLVEYPLTEVELREEIHQSQVVECSSTEFLANPDAFLGELVANRPGAMLSLPEHYCIAYSGGTGRTTLALDTALHFSEVLSKRRGRDEAEASGLEIGGNRALLLELVFGISSLAAVTGMEMPHLYQLVTDTEVRPTAFKGVDLLPMDYENVRVLSSEFVKRYFDQQMAAHRLSVVDATWPHSLASALEDKVDLWLVVATERPDTIVNAQRLGDELSARYGENKVWLLQNAVSKSRKRGNNGSQARDTLSWNVRVPSISSADNYRGDMGKVVLSHVFAPIWSEYIKPGRSGLFS